MMEVVLLSSLNYKKKIVSIGFIVIKAYTTITTNTIIIHVYTILTLTLIAVAVFYLT